MAGTVLPRGDPHSLPQLPVEDERELLNKGTQGVASAIARQPILGTYLPVHPINRYTHKKWDTGDWSRHNENKYFQASRDRDASKSTREEAKELIHSTNTKANSTQNGVTHKLGERVQNINFWKFDLERTIQDMTAENDLLVTEIRRIEQAIQALEVPTHIAKDCLSNRQRRIDTDLVQDNAENQLLKELETISYVKDSLSGALRNARDQLEANREAKHRLEMDWSDKVSAHRLDSKNTSLKNSRGNVMHRPGAASYKEMESQPVDWSEFSQANIRHAEHEREASIRLRGQIGMTLSQTSQDMREQADRVEEAFARRVAETEEATRNLEAELKQTVDEIASMETNIVNLNEALWEKQAPLKVAGTRLGNRHQRPNIEMCRDEPSHRLIEEVHELEHTCRQLEHKIQESEDRCRDLQHTRLALEREINIKRNSLTIDRDRCLRIRGLFPSTNLLCGFGK